MIVARRSLLALGAIVSLIVVAGSCAGDEPTDPLFRGTTVTIHDAPGDDVLLQDRTVRLRATVRSEDGAPLPDLPVTWRSSDSDRATVSATGEVTAHRMGEVEISASAGGATDTRRMSVRLAVPVPADRDDGALTSTLLDGLVRLTVPARALDAGDVLHLRPAVAPPANARLIASSAIDLGPASTSFDETVTLALAYPDDVPAIERGFLRIFRVNDGTWSIVGGTLDLTQGRVRANISRAGTYALFRRAAPASLVLRSGNGQQASTGGAVAAPPRVVARDADAAPVEGAVVRFSVLSGGGTIVGADSGVSDGAGEAALLGEWRLGPSPGVNELRATLAGSVAAPVTFNATATAAPSTSAAVVTRQLSGAVSGFTATTQPRVELRTATGALSPVDALVHVELASGTGTLSGTRAVMSVNGVAAFTDLRVDGWASHRLRFSTGSISQEGTTFTVQQLLQSLIVLVQPGDAEEDRNFKVQPEIGLRDHAGLPFMAAKTVTASLASGDGDLEGGRSVTSSGGVARFSTLKIDDDTGPHVLQFRTTSPTLSVNSAPFEVRKR